MKVKVGISLLVCMMLVVLGMTGGMGTIAAAADGELGELLVYSTWSAQSEISALNEIKKRFEAEGGIWNVFTIAHDSGANISLINMISGGNPPDAWSQNSVKMRREFLERGLINDFTELYTTLDVDDKLPEAVRYAIRVDEKILSAPLGIHIDGTLFYNKHVAADCGIDPEAWTSLDEMFHDFDAIRAKGYIPLAIGG